MPGTHIVKRVGALVVALAALNVPPTHAATPAGAQLGPVWTGGNLTSGGTLTYQLNLTVTSPGAAVAKATVRGKRWRASFPILSNSLSVGFATVSSAAISIPTNFQGTAVLRVTGRFNKRSIGGKAVLISIAAPSTTPAAPQTTWYDVGFNSNVTVNADAVSTNGMTLPLTYAWSITDTDVRTNATFSSITTNAPKFNTLPLTSFTNTLEVTSGGVTNVLDPIDLDNTFDLASNSNLVHFTSEQVTKSTYDLQVIVSDAASHSATGNVTVISTSVSPGQPSIPIGERQYLTAAPNGTNASTYSWSVTAAPSGSTAKLENPKTRTPSLRPDVEGDYVLQLAVAGGGQTNSSFVTVRGATYVGVATCASCHGTSPKVGLSDYYTPWSQTKHATMAQRGVDGLLGSDYDESCFACHTVGYNKSPAATNGNFYAVQQQLGWTLPSPLQVGNYASMPTNLQNLANIQCESCHGPGSQHPGKESANLDVAVCGQCHQENAEDNQRVEQWRLGPHGADDKYLSVSLEEAANSSCTKCHSPASFVDNLKGKALTRLEAGRLTCQACHDPHNVAQFPAEAHQVRVYDTVTLDDSVATPPTLTGQGPSALCMSCHNARRSPPPTYISSGSNTNRLPHESTATDVLLGLRASTNVQAIVAGVTNTIATVELVNSAHSGVAKCVNCHMYKTGSNTFGDHTFSMTDRLTGEANIAACNQCHTGVDPVTEAEGFDHISVARSGFANAGDYDGTNGVQGVQTEVNGVLTNLVNKMLATGLIKSTGGTAWGGYTNIVSFPVIRAAQRNAAWNEYLIERELSHGVHNTAFTVRLLQWSYTVLSTNTGGNAYEVDFPNADLR